MALKLTRAMTCTGECCLRNPPWASEMPLDTIRSDPEITSRGFPRPVEASGDRSRSGTTQERPLEVGCNSEMASVASVWLQIGAKQKQRQVGPTCDTPGLEPTVWEVLLHSKIVNTLVLKTQTKVKRVTWVFKGSVYFNSEHWPCYSLTQYSQVSCFI